MSYINNVAIAGGTERSDLESVSLLLIRQGWCPDPIIINMLLPLMVV